jgi:hypothetical protein
MKSELSLSYLKEPTTGPHSQPTELSLYPYNLIIYYPAEYHPLVYTNVSRQTE